MQVTAIYARKSILADKGESIQNQIDRCQAYATMRGWDTKIFFDEDYSGKDINRPQFQEMLRSIELGEIQNVIFYRLDRVSRRVLDIINFIDDLNRKGVGFISISENFDTTTPMGRAMLLITAVFAQLERETIAERVRDNMHDLARKGRWNGGLPPYGYISERKTFDGVKTSVLLHDPDKVYYVKQIFTWCSEGDTLRMIGDKLLAANARTLRNGCWDHSTVARIIHNPIYCIADRDAYNYFMAHGMDICSTIDEWDGSRGVMCYNRHTCNSDNFTLKNKSEWIISVGLHEGIVPGKIFEAANVALNDRKLLGNTPTNKGILSAGILKCGCCGRNMNIVSGSQILDQASKCRVTYYRCRSKVSRHLESCNNTNIRTDKLDEYIIEKIKELSANPEIINKQISDIKLKAIQESSEIDQRIGEIDKRIQKISTNISRLLDLLLDNKMPSNAIQSKILEHQAELEKLGDLKIQYEKDKIASSSMMINADLVKQNINSFVKDIDTASINEKRQLIGQIVESIIWTKGEVQINIWGTSDIKKKLYFSDQRFRTGHLHIQFAAGSAEPEPDGKLETDLSLFQ